jgi:hypothetical protein
LFLLVSPINVTLVSNFENVRLPTLLGVGFYTKFWAENLSKEVVMANPRFVARHGRAFVRGPVNALRSIHAEQGKFGRLFPILPSFAPDIAPIREALLKIGAANGPMNPGDQLNDPIKSIENPDPDNPDNANVAGKPIITAGMTFLGQFIDHDMTFDAASSLERQQDPDLVRNFRIPALELDSIYGSGPGASEHLYDQTVDGGATTFYVEEIPGSDKKSYDKKVRYDIPRNAQLTALTGDPRNDENLMISQLHLGFLRFHNKVVERVKAEDPGLNATDVFLEAQRLVRWHYQWIVVHEFLKLIIGDKRVERILEQGNRLFRPRAMPFMPVEFSVAAYRFGHSQVRPSYRANFGPTGGKSQFFAFIFKDSLPDTDDPDDLRGQKRAPRRFIDQQTFFDMSTVPGRPEGPDIVKPNKKIDTKLSTVLFDLVGLPGVEPQSLAQRNLLRNLVFGVPSGQSVAKVIGFDPVNNDQLPLSPAELDELKTFNVAGQRFERSTPLWYYVLKEAEVRQEGKRLGYIGGLIVGEVIIGFLKGDPTSYLSQQPNWDPSKEEIIGFDQDFNVARLLDFAGVVPLGLPPQ